jgi:hypothetical protein
MTIRTRENNYTASIDEVIPGIKKAAGERPNIDHLIKKIIVEKRKEKRQNILIIITVIVLVASGSTFLI